MAKGVGVTAFLRRKHIKARRVKNTRIDSEKYEQSDITKKVRAERVWLRHLLRRLGVSVSTSKEMELHHKNGDPFDNRIENVQAVNSCAHHQTHGRECIVTTNANTKQRSVSLHALLMRAGGTRAVQEYNEAVHNRMQRPPKCSVFGRQFACSQLYKRVKGKYNWWEWPE